MNQLKIGEGGVPEDIYNFSMSLFLLFHEQVERIDFELLTPMLKLGKHACLVMLAKYACLM